MNPRDFHELRNLAHLDARKRAYRDTACSGKHTFDSFDAARRTMNRDLLKVARPYHCGSCGGFHIGSIATRRGKRMAAVRAGA